MILTERDVAIGRVVFSCLNANSAAEAFVRLRRAAERVFSKSNDGELLVTIGRMLRLVAGLDHTWPGDDVARQLADSPSHARGFLLEALDDAEAHLLGIEKHERWP